MIKRIINKIFVVWKSVGLRIFALNNGSWIALSAKIYIHGGGRFLIGRGVRVLPDVIISVLPGGELELKDGVIVNHASVIYCASTILIGKKARISHFCSIIDHDYDYRMTDVFDKPKVSSPIRLGNGVWLGTNVVVLKGVEIGDNSVIGAMTLVSKSVPAKCVAHGKSNNELIIRRYDEFDY